MVEESANLKYRLFSIIVECFQDESTGFYKTYTVLATNQENAANCVLSLDELTNLYRVKIEEVDEFEEIENNAAIIEETGKAFFNINEEE